MNRVFAGLPIVIPAILTLLLAGCGGDDPATGRSGASSGAATGRTASAPGAAVFIISPVNGSTVGSPVTVRFGISGMTVAPAGQFTNDSGHHHLLIDTALENPDQPIPNDAAHLHFGKGQTETTIELAPGQHTLQLVLGDGNHIPHDPPVISKVVTFTVE